MENRKDHGMIGISSVTHRSIKVFSLEVDGNLAYWANKQVVDWTFIFMHVHTHNHTHAYIQVVE